MAEPFLKRPTGVKKDLKRQKDIQIMFKAINKVGCDQGEYEHEAPCIIGGITVESL